MELFLLHFISDQVITLLHSLATHNEGALSRCVVRRARRHLQHRPKILWPLIHHFWRCLGLRSLPHLLGEYRVGLVRPPCGHRRIELASLLVRLLLLERVGIPVGGVWSELLLSCGLTRQPGELVELPSLVHIR